MTDELKLHKARERASQAEDLLRSPLLHEAFVALEARYIEEWAMTQFRDAEAREKLWMAVNVNRKHQDLFKNMIADGKLAQAELNKLTGLNKLAG